MSTELETARQIVAAGVPVFVARPNPEYDKTDKTSREFFLPDKWQETPASQTVLDAWQPGDALCLVAGHGLDAIDVDPKNGASVEEQRERLAALDVDVIGTVVTPSGGAHFYVRSVGVCTVNLPRVGVDYRGRGLDNTGGGFLYLPGTNRPKYDGKGYLWANLVDEEALEDLGANDEDRDTVTTYLTGLGAKVRTRRESAPAEEVGGEPVEVGTLRPWLRDLLADIGPSWQLPNGSKSEDRSERFFHLVAACRRAGLSQGQTVTVLNPWCHAVGKYTNRVAEEVARTWEKVKPEEKDSPESPSVALDALEALGTSSTQEEGEETKSSSWTPVDLDKYLDGTFEKTVATMFPRTDGVCLLYPGLIHSFHGESESGKSFILQSEAARLLSIGESVLYLDFESDPEKVVERLLLFGTTPEAIRKGFVYVNPETGLKTPEAREDFHSLLDRPYALAVIDGVTDAIWLLAPGMGKIEEQIADYVRLLPRRIAKRTGAAVVQVDHVPKSKDQQVRHAIGSQHKMNTLTGAAYTVDIAEPIGDRKKGVVILRVAKDRPGQVRPESGLYRKSDRTQEAARIVIDSTGAGPTVVTVEPPRTRLGEETETEARPLFRPTVLMERISRYLEGQPEGISGSAIKTAIGGKAEFAGQALEVLVSEGYVQRVSGPRNAKLHTSTNTYREFSDPLSDKYPTAGTGGEENSEVIHRNDPESDPFPFPVLRQGEQGTGGKRLSTHSREQLGTGGEQLGTGQGVADIDPWTSPKKSPIHACSGPGLCKVIGCEAAASSSSNLETMEGNFR